MIRILCPLPSSETRERREENTFRGSLEKRKNQWKVMMNYHHLIQEQHWDIDSEGPNLTPMFPPHLNIYFTNLSTRNVNQLTPLFSIQNIPNPIDIMRYCQFVEGGFEREVSVHMVTLPNGFSTNHPIKSTG